MAIRYLPSGVFEFDTVDEALQFHAASFRRTNGNAALPKGLSLSVSPPKGADFEGFLKSLQDHQTALLSRIVSAEEAISTEALAEQVELEPGQVGPMLRHIRTRAQQYHIDPDKLIRSVAKRNNPGERPSRVYSTRYAEHLKGLLQAYAQSGQ